MKSGITITDEAHNVLLLVDGIGPDIMFDIISNICKDIFSEFTIKQCEKYKVSLPEKYIIEYFDDISGSWQKKEFNLPCYERKKIILVPEFHGCKRPVAVYRAAHHPILTASAAGPASASAAGRYPLPGFPWSAACRHRRSNWRQP